VEKLALLRWRRTEEAPDTDALLTGADRICRAGHWATAYVEHTGAAAAFRYGNDPGGLVLSSALTVWVERHEQAEALVDHLPPAARTAAYLLTESVPLEWPDRDWVDGTTSPGVALLTTFPRTPGLDDQTFFDRWHGSHSALTFRIHPVRRYVRNSVARALGDAPDADAIVTEAFDQDDLLDPSRFYGVGAPELRWQDAMAMINEDLLTFCDLDRLQTAPVDEVLLASAPWER
jgi:hypothetical protein